MQPLDARAYFLNLDPTARQAWIDGIDLFRQAAGSAYPSLFKLMDRQNDLRYDHQAHAFVELPKCENLSDLKALCSVWRQDHFQLLLQKVGCTSQEVLKFLEAKAAKKTAGEDLIPHSLDKFLDKFNHGRVKSLPDKARDGLNKRMQAVVDCKNRVATTLDRYNNAVRKHEKESLYIPGLNLQQAAREAAQLPAVGPELQAMRDRFVQGVQAIAVQGRAAQTKEQSALQQLLDDLQYPPREMVRLLAAIAPQAQPVLRQFFQTYSQAIWNVRLFEEEPYMQAQQYLNHAEIELAKFRGDALPAHVTYDANAKRDLAVALTVASQGRSPVVKSPQIEAQIKAFDAEIAAFDDHVKKNYHPVMEKNIREGLDAIHRLDMPSAWKECLLASHNLGADGAIFAKWVGLLKDKALGDNLFSELFSPDKFIERFPAFMDQLSQQPNFASYQNLRGFLHRVGEMLAVSFNLFEEAQRAELQIQPYQKQRDFLNNQLAQRASPRDDDDVKIKTAAEAFLKVAGEPNPAAFMAAMPKIVVPQFIPAAALPLLPGQLLPGQPIPVQGAVPAPAGGNNAARGNQMPGVQNPGRPVKAAAPGQNAAPANAIAQIQNGRPPGKADAPDQNAAPAKAIAQIQNGLPPGKAEAPAPKVSKPVPRKERFRIMGLFKRAAVWIKSLFARFFSLDGIDLTR